MNLDFQTFLALAGIAISILLFLIGYRKTIGAKKERVQTANKEIIESLLKRLVLEDFAPRTDEIERFASGKATDYLIRPQDVMSVDEIIDSLYTRVLDNDFIGPDQRRKIVDRLRTLSEVEDEEVISSETMVETATTRTRTKYSALLLALASTIAASGVVFIIGILFNQESFGRINKDALIPVIVTFLTSFATLIPIILLRRLKDSQEQTRISNPAEKYSELEKGIIQLLRERGIPFEYNNEGPYDWHIKGKHRSYLVELKSSLTRLPSQYLQSLIKRLEESAIASKASSFIVSVEPVPDRIKSLETNHVKIINFDEFKRMLKKLA